MKAFSGASGLETASFLPYGGAFVGGVRVAAGDVNGDGTADIITGLGPGGGPHVKAFSGVDQSELKSFFSQAVDFSDGIYVAAGDVNDDGFDDIVTGGGTDNGGLVRAFSGADNSPLHTFYAFPAPKREVRVAAGDVNGDGFADIIASQGEGVAPHVKVFDGTNLNELHSFLAYAPAFTGGVYVGAGDVDRDGRADIITGAGVGGATHVKVFSGAGGGEMHSFFAFPGVNNEVRVAGGDVNGDGFDDIITGLGAGLAPHVKAFDGTDLSTLHSFLAYGPSFLGGTYVAGIPAAPIPEPATSLLALSGLTLIAMRWRSRRYRMCPVKSASINEVCGGGGQ